jgi:hypothetical protein
MPLRSDGIFACGLTMVTANLLRLLNGSENTVGL